MNIYSYEIISKEQKINHIQIAIPTVQAITAVKSSTVTHLSLLHKVPEVINLGLHYPTRSKHL